MQSFNYWQQESGSTCQARKRLEVGKLNSQFLWFATAFGQRFWKWISECIPMRIPRGLASVRCWATVNATRHPQDAHWLMSQVPRWILSSSVHSGVQGISSAQWRLAQVAAADANSWKCSSIFCGSSCSSCCWSWRCQKSVVWFSSGTRIASLHKN